MKKVVYSSLFLGISLLSFGGLKFIDPFKSWYHVQIYNSGLGSIAYTSGIAGEIITGIVFILVIALKNKLNRDLLAFSVAVASVSTIAMMLAATFVHMQPHVPADVLPLKIKAPFIPIVFLLVAVVNLISILKIRSNDIQRTISRQDLKSS